MKNKRKNVSILGIIIVLTIIGLWISGIIPKILENGKTQNKVIIKDGNIKNENLIDEFIENANKEKELELEIIQDNEKIKLKYIPGENAIARANAKENETIPQYVPDNDSVEEYKRIYGYYILTKNDEEVKESDALNFFIKKKCKDKEIYLIFDKIETIDLENQIIICKYNLDSSEYKEKFKINCSQKTDKKIETIIDKNKNSEYDYNVYTFGIDVSITIEDKMYSLEDAIQQNLITADDIVEQAKIDSEYGICKEDFYLDGGSTEYLYSDYTILKYNTLFDEKDLVIGMKGQIMDKVDKILNR